MLVKCKVLIIDGGESTRTFMRFVLTNSGYRVSVAHTAAKTLEMLAEEMFDVILIDPRLPDMDGIDLIKEIRLIDAFKSCPILGVSQPFNTTIQANGKAAGVTDWIDQPVSPHNLTEVIKEIAPDPEVYDD